MAWTTIPNANLEPDAPARSVDALALRDNPIAIAAGDSGAPKVVFTALDNGVVSAGAVQSWRYLTEQGTPALGGYRTEEGDIVTEQFTIRVMTSGTIRCSLEHRRELAGSPQGFARIVKNGVQQAEWSTGLSTFTTRTHDLTVSEGDTVQFQQNCTGAGDAIWRNLQLLADKVFWCNSELGR